MSIGREQRDEATLWGIPLLDWAWITALAAWRLVIASRLGLGVDEAHYAIYGLRPDWSFFDHPPLVGWTQTVFLSLLPLQEWGVRFPAIVCGLLSTILIYKLLLEFSTTAAARAGALALNSAFIIAAMWMMYLPDTPLMVLTLWLIWITTRLMQRECWTDWLALGVCLGLAGLAKYTAVFLVLSLVGFIATERAWNRIRPKGLALAIAIAATLISPVIIWNYQNDWISFKFQTDHVVGPDRFQLKTFWLFLAGQFAGYSPFLIVPALAGWVVRRSQLPLAARLSIWIAAPTFLFFAYASFKDEVLLHWPMIAWGVLLPFGMALAWNGRLLKWAKGGLIISLFLTAFLLSELTFRFLRYPDNQSPYNDLTGWPEIRESVERIKRENPARQFAVGVPHWTHGGRAKFYLSDLASVFVLDARFDQFDIWEKSQTPPKEYLVLEWRGFELGSPWKERCGALEPVEKRTFRSHGRTIIDAQLSWCTPAQ